MREYKKDICQRIVFAIAILLVTGIFQTEVMAKTVTDKENNVTYDDKISINIGYVYEYYQGGNDYIHISLENKGDRVVNVKSNSKNLLVKKSQEDYYANTDWETGEKETVYNNTYISLYGKKKGNYKVTFDVMKADGTIRCKKTIKVSVKSSSSSTVFAIKSIKYAGKDIWTYQPYATKTSGKLKVNMNRGYKLKSIEIGKINKKGIMVYKKVKNNAKINLAKSEKYNYTYYGSDGYVSKSSTNSLFPATYIRITYRNNKKKQDSTIYYSLRTINTK